MRACNAQNTRLRLMASIDQNGGIGVFEVGRFEFTPNCFFNKINYPMPLTLGNEWSVFSYPTLSPP